MTLELIISLVSLMLSTACSVLTVLATIKVGKLNNIEALHKYEKKITKFELSFRDEAWFYSIIYGGEFSNYNEESQKLIFEWWQEYKKVHKPKKVKQTLPNSKPFGGEKFKVLQSPINGPIKGKPGTRRPRYVPIKSEVTIDQVDEPLIVTSPVNIIEED